MNIITVIFLPRYISKFFEETIIEMCKRTVLAHFFVSAQLNLHNFLYIIKIVYFIYNHLYYIENTQNKRRRERAFVATNERRQCHVIIRIFVCILSQVIFAFIFYSYHTTRQIYRVTNSLSISFDLSIYQAIQLTYQSTTVLMNRVKNDAS